ncbi:MAG: cytochrome b N-terminal domain-containing protein [Candidatus Hodgkinia cicadicola]|nr:MAG: cytochrome b N-terminal domain-containing protein [Candidatus Hodgkinia cicadicola]
MNWIAQLSCFEVPRHANLLYVLGGVLLFALCFQILTGLSMAIHYLPTTASAFESINEFVRKFKYGWLVRSAHANGASLFFCALCFHVFRAVYYRSYIGSRKLVWMVGSAMYILALSISFMGLVLPWGQLSYWAAVVITNFVEAVPAAGKWIKLLVLGGFNIRDATLKRFFVFHCFLPFVVLFLAVLHVVLVHLATQNSPIPNRLPLYNSFVRMFPFFALKDTAFVFGYLLAICFLCLVVPNAFLNRHNHNPTNYYVTPTDIKPEWYFLPYYSVLRGFDSKPLGVVSVVSVLVFMVLLPYTHESLPSVVFKSFYKLFATALFLSFSCLGILGVFELGRYSDLVAKLCTAWCFAFSLCPFANTCWRKLKLEIFKAKLVARLWIKALAN